MTWRNATLGELFDLKYGKALPDRNRVKTGLTPVYGSNGVVGCHDNAITKGPTIVVGRKGSAGRVAYSAVPCWPIDTTYFIDDFGDSHDSRFWAYQFQSLRLDEFEKSTAIPGLNRDDAYTRVCSYPDNVDEQRRVANKLDQIAARLDDAKTRIDTIPTILKRFRMSVLAAACSGRLTEDWRREYTPESADILLRRIIKRRSNTFERMLKQAAGGTQRKPKQWAGLEMPTLDTTTLPESPDSWTYCHLQNLGEFTRGKSKHRPRDDPKLYGGPYPFIQTGDVANSGGKITTHRQTYSKAGLAQSRLFPAGTLCVTIAANIADTAILTYPACFPDSVVGLIPDKEFVIEWARYYISVIQSNLEMYAPATAQKNINMEILESVPVPLPPYQEQVEIVHRVDALMKHADAIEDRYRKARAFTDKLMPSVLSKAFRGELV